MWTTNNFLFLIFAFLDMAFVDSRKYFMDEICGNTIKLDAYREHFIEMEQSRSTKYHKNMDCHVVLKTEPSYKFIIVFKSLEVEYEPMCDDDYLKVMDGNTTSSPNVEGLATKICGYSKPAGSYVSSGRYLTLLFKSDAWANDDGFDVLLTVYREAPCNDDEFKCRNSRCIAARLQCDGSNNCGDYSDECQLSPTVILAIIVSIFIVTILGIGIMIYIRRVRHGRGLKKNKTEDWSVFKAEEPIHAVLRNKATYITSQAKKNADTNHLPKVECTSCPNRDRMELRVANLCNENYSGASSSTKQEHLTACRHNSSAI